MIIDVCSRSASRKSRLRRKSKAVLPAGACRGSGNYALGGLARPIVW